MDIKQGGELTEESLLQGLNPAQAEAVQALEGPVLVTAGAGAGKTATLIRRVANLIRTGRAPPTSSC